MSRRVTVSRNTLCWLVTGLYTTALWIGTHLPEGHEALELTLAWTGGDKMAHFLGYLGLALLVFVGCLGRVRGFGRLAALLVLAVLGACDELTQPWVGRPAEWLDWAADLAGLGLGCLLAPLCRRSVSSNKTFRGPQDE